MRSIEDVLRVASKGKVEVALKFADEVKRLRLREEWQDSENLAYGEYHESFFHDVKLYDENGDMTGIKVVLIDESEKPVEFDVWQAERIEYEEPESVVLDADLKEAIRKAYQAKRDGALTSATIEVDSMVFDFRPQDIANYDFGIAMGTDRKWILADNSIAVVTAAQLQQVKSLGLAQLAAIYDEYIDVVEVL